MASTYNRVRAVVVDPAFSKINDGFLDAGFNGGSFAGNLAQENSVQASSGACYRGMPIARSLTTGKLVPISQASSSAQAVYEGILGTDITAYVVARDSKIAVVQKGRVRSYAGGALTIGDWVKADTSASFAGVVKWVAGTDSEELKIGRAYPLDDGSASHTGAGLGETVATAINQGDTIFVDLI